MAVDIRESMTQRSRDFCREEEGMIVEVMKRCC